MFSTPSPVVHSTSDQVDTLIQSNFTFWFLKILGIYLFSQQNIIHQNT